MNAGGGSAGDCKDSIRASVCLRHKKGPMPFKKRYQMRPGVSFASDFYGNCACSDRDTAIPSQSMSAKPLRYPLLRYKWFDCGNARIFV